MKLSTTKSTMTMITLGLCLLAFGAGAGHALQASTAPVAEAIAQMAAVDDVTTYTATRNGLVARGPAVLAELEPLADQGASWRERAAASACIGWIEHGAQYEAFLAVSPMPTARGGLRYRGDTADRDALYTPLLVELAVWTEPAADRRAAAVEMLQNIRDPRATEALGWVLLNDESLDVQFTAADVLARADDPAATDQLAAALRDAADARVRAAAAGSIGWRKDPAASGVLLDALAHDEAGECRAAAAQSLGWLRDPSTALALSVALAGDPDSMVRRKAAMALGKVGGDEAVQALQAAIESDTDAEVVRLATHSLGRLQ
jgi:HEAT repeat protein